MHLFGLRLLDKTLCSFNPKLNDFYDKYNVLVIIPGCLHRRDNLCKEMCNYLGVIDPTMYAAYRSHGNVDS